MKSIYGLKRLAKCVKGIYIKAKRNLDSNSQKDQCLYNKNRNDLHHIHGNCIMAAKSNEQIREAVAGLSNKIKSRMREKWLSTSE